MTSLEAVLPQTAASISFDAKTEFGRSAESTEAANGTASDTGMAALLGMWATIFQQQVLPEPIAAGQGTAWQEGGNSAVSEAQASPSSGATEDSTRSGKGAPVLAADILSLVGGQAVQASILWQPVTASATTAVADEAESSTIAASIIAPEASPLPTPLSSALPLQTAQPLSTSTMEATTENTQVLEAIELELPSLVPEAAPEPARKDASIENPAMQSTMTAFEPIPSIPVQQKSKSPNPASEIVSGEKNIAANPAPIPADLKVTPAIEPPPLETVVNLKRKVSERILPKTPTVDFQPAVDEPKEESSIVELAASVNPKPESAEPTATTAPHDPNVEAEAAAIQEPKLALEQTVPDATPMQDAPILKTSSEAASPSPAPHSLEPAPRAASGPTQAPPPPPAAAPQRTRAAFVPEAPPTPLASREAKTISIRIPLNDSSAAIGAPARHLDLIFNQRNNDLTLQFTSPNTEIQGRIEESMPTLLNKLQTENWTARPAELAATVPQPDLGFDGRRRAESILPSPNQFDSMREPVVNAGTSSQGFNFDDSPAERKDAQNQSEQGRNRKKEQAWQNEFDEQLEP